MKDLRNVTFHLEGEMHRLTGRVREKVRMKSESLTGDGILCPFRDFTIIKRVGSLD